MLRMVNLRYTVLLFWVQYFTKCLKTLNIQFRIDMERE